MQRRPLHQLNRVDRAVPPAAAALGRHHHLVSSPVRPNPETDIRVHSSQRRGQLVSIGNDRWSLQ